MGGAYKENWLLSQNIAIIINELKHSYYNHAVHVYTCMYIHKYIYIYIYIYIIIHVRLHVYICM